MRRLNRFRVPTGSECFIYEKENVCDEHQDRCTWRGATRPDAKIKREASCVNMANFATREITPDEAKDLVTSGKFVYQVARNRRGKLYYIPLTTELTLPGIPEAPKMTRFFPPPRPVAHPAFGIFTPDDVKRLVTEGKLSFDDVMNAPQFKNFEEAIIKDLDEGKKINCEKSEHDPIREIYAWVASLVANREIPYYFYDPKETKLLCNAIYLLVQYKRDPKSVDPKYWDPSSLPRVVAEWWKRFY